MLLICCQRYIGLPQPRSKRQKLMISRKDCLNFKNLKFVSETIVLKFRKVRIADLCHSIFPSRNFCTAAKVSFEPEVDIDNIRDRHLRLKGQEILLLTSTRLASGSRK